MQKYENDVHSAEAAETLKAARAVIRVAGLAIERGLPILPRLYAHYLIASDANLLIVPSTTTNGSDRPRAEGAMRMARFDTVIVRISRSNSGVSKVLVDVGIYGPAIAWHQEYRACRIGGVLHFAPDSDPAGPIFRLTKSGLLCSTPWGNAAGPHGTMTP